MATTHDATHDKKSLLDFCTVPRSRKEMMEYMGLSNRRYFWEHYLKPMLEDGSIRMTIPDKPRSKNQKYVKN